MGKDSNIGQKLDKLLVRLRDISISTTTLDFIMLPLFCRNLGNSNFKIQIVPLTLEDDVLSKQCYD